VALRRAIRTDLSGRLDADDIGTGRALGIIGCALAELKGSSVLNALSGVVLSLRASFAHNEARVAHGTGHVQGHVFQEPHLFVLAVIPPRPEFAVGGFGGRVGSERINRIENTAGPEGTIGFFDDAFGHRLRYFVEENVIGDNVEVVVWEPAVFGYFMHVVGFDAEVDRSLMGVPEHGCANIAAPYFGFREPFF
jgi:hypothetical protein